MHDKFNLAQIPSAACRLAGGEVEIGDNGDNAKTAPIRLKARSGQPIEHWYWGKVVHDLAGMRLSKPRLTVDYAHNDNEVLGYLNHFNTESGDLITSGALTPFRDDDRASEVLYKMRQGVPYEASIFFGGDGIKIEEIGDGMMTQVNGRQFDGPGIVIREWPLRGVAICPYGADQNTESAAMSSGETYTATKVQAGDGAMNEETAVEVEAVAEAQAVEAVAVDTEANAELLESPEASLADRIAELDVLLQTRTTDVERLTGELAEATTALGETVTERDALAVERDALKVSLDGVEAELKTARDELAECSRRLAAVEAGAPPVSASPAPKDSELTPWQKAQQRSK